MLSFTSKPYEVLAFKPEVLACHSEPTLLTSTEYIHRSWTDGVGPTLVVAASNIDMKYTLLAIYKSCQPYPYRLFSPRFFRECLTWLFTTQSAADNITIGNSPFLDLPPEIRLKIYEHLLDLRSGGSTEYIPSRMLREPPMRFQGQATAPQDAQRSGQLLRTCRTCYNEFLPLVYRRLHLSHWTSDHSRPGKVSWTWSKFLLFSARIGAQGCKSIRHLSVDGGGLFFDITVSQLSKIPLDKSKYPGLRILEIAFGQVHAPMHLEDNEFTEWGIVPFGFFEGLSIMVEDCRVYWTCESGDNQWVKLLDKTIAKLPQVSRK
jgi:hypothetical protein